MGGDQLLMSHCTFSTKAGQNIRVQRQLARNPAGPKFVLIYSNFANLSVCRASISQEIEDFQQFLPLL
jgi:hypothetical protein